MKPPFKLEHNIKQYNFHESLRYLEHIGKLKYGATFKIHKSDIKVIYKLLVHSLRDKENCKKHGIDLDKGILLNGPVGCGKTSLMTLCRYFTEVQNSYLIKTTRDIALEYNKDGFPAINKYGKTPKIYCLDDLGIENAVKHFGNECNTVAEILLHRYELQVNQGIITHATTNLNAGELEKMYGSRVRSRLRSMFNLVTFERESTDKRK